MKMMSGFGLILITVCTMRYEFGIAKLECLNVTVLYYNLAATCGAVGSRSWRGDEGPKELEIVGSNII